MRLGMVSVFTAMLLLVLATSSYAFFIDFEQGFGFDGMPIAGDYTGIFFTQSAGLDWLYGDSNTNLYNTHSVDLNISWNADNYNHYGYCWAWLGYGGNWGRIDFTSQDGTYFQIRYCSGGGTGLTLEAYDVNDVLIDTAWGPDNLRGGGALDMGTLLVNGQPNNPIAWVKIYDSGNYFLVDHLQGDFTGVTPVTAKTWGAIKGMFK